MTRPFSGDGLADFFAGATAQKKPSADTLVDEQTGAYQVPLVEPTPPTQPVDPVEAESQAKRLIRMRDQAQAFLLAWLSGNTQNSQAFRLEGWEFEMLIELYRDQIIKLGKLPAWLELIMVEGLIMGPRIAKVLDFRKIMARNAELERENAYYRQAAGAQQPGALPQRMRRRDGKRMWTVDNAGFFEYDVRGERIKISERMDRPNVDLDWDMLVKWNSAEKLMLAFNRAVA